MVAATAPDALRQDASDLPGPDEVLPLAEHLRAQERAAAQLLAQRRAPFADTPGRRWRPEPRGRLLLVDLARDLVDGRGQSFQR